MRSKLSLLTLLWLAACGRGGQDLPSLSAATVNGQGSVDSGVVVRRIIGDSGERIVGDGGKFDFRYGTPSRDGRYFTGNSPKTGNLVVRDMRTGEKRVLTRHDNLRNQAEAEISWMSPDDKSVVFLWNNGRPSDYEVRTIGMNGSGERTLVKSGFPDERLYPTDLSPDGRRLVAVNYRKDKSHQITLVSTTDGSTVVLKSLDWRAPARMQFSPDGRWIAYDFRPDQGSNANDLYVIQADGGHEWKITSDTATKLLVGWAPDGRGLYYSTSKNDMTTIWYLPVRDGRAAGAPTVVRADIWQAQPLGVSGGTLYYSVSTATVTLSLLAIGADDGRAIGAPIAIDSGSPPGFINGSPVWSPDGQSVAFPRQRGQGGCGPGIHDEIVIRNIASGEERSMLVALECTSPISWLPDGRTLIAQGNLRGRRDFYRIDLVTGNVEPLRDERGRIVFRGATGHTVEITSQNGISQTIWHDEHTEFVVSNDAQRGSGVIALRQVASNDNREIYQGRGANFAQLSPDGQTLAFLTPDTASSTPCAGSFGNRLMVIPKTGEAARVLYVQHCPGLIAGGSLNWTPDSRHVLFTASENTRGGSGATSLMALVNVQTGEARQLPSTGHGIVNPRLSPDGRRVFYAASSGTRSELWAMEKLPGTGAKRTGGSR